MTNDRPSIAELQRAHECAVAGCWTGASDMIVEAAPVLLEIAAAALALDEQFDFSEAARVFHDPPMQRLIAALSKVRP